ncbi:MAG: hypothetical protein LBC94_04110 [Desulfovibrio sp.]|jgi:hypothetical protein|nr:hypothetical protein [Desulfovibrio sp.]
MPGRIQDAAFHGGPLHLSAEEREKHKRGIYEKMNPRRRKFIERIGYENWDPFQKPNDPLDLRTDATRRTADQLVGEFLRRAAGKDAGDNDYVKGAWECALGIVNSDGKFRGVFDFCLWYHELLQKEEKGG